MNTRKSLFSRCCAAAQIYLIIFYCMYLPPGLASSIDLSFSDLTKLSSLETVIYGNSYKNLPSERRINSLEKIIFGKIQKGPLPVRLTALVATINGEHNKQLSPPIAPELDRSDTLTKTATPPVAPQASSDKNDFYQEMPPTAQSDRVKMMLQQAMQLYSQGQVNQAETVFKNVLALDSHNSDANFNLGAIAEGKSDWDDALHYYQAALNEQPDDKDIQAAVQSIKGKMKEAQANKQEFSQQNQPAKLSQPQLDALREKVGQAASYYQSGNYDAAINLLKEVASQAPDQSDVQFALGQAYKAKGDNADAQAALSRAAALAPNNEQYRSALAELNQQMPGMPDNRSADSFASNGNALANNNAAPQGQITPFSDDGSAGLSGGNQGWQSTGPSTRFFSGSSSFGPSLGYTPSYGYMPGYVSGGYNPYGYGFGGGMGTAAMTGLAGMAIGSMFGLMMSHHRRW